jgi:hypothetical protein
MTGQEKGDRMGRFDCIHFIKMSDTSITVIYYTLSLTVIYICSIQHICIDINFIIQIKVLLFYFS